MKRRLFTLAAAVSLLLCVATVVLWARSYWVADDTEIAGWTLLSRQGALHLTNLPTVLRNAEVLQQQIREWTEFLHDERFARHVGATGISRHPPPLEDVGFEVRKWSLHFAPIALLAAFPPMLWYFNPQRRRAKRRRLGLCASCGYDVRATPDRCPECGIVLHLK